MTEKRSIQKVESPVSPDQAAAQETQTLQEIHSRMMAGEEMTQKISEARPTLTKLRAGEVCHNPTHNFEILEAVGSLALCRMTSKPAGSFTAFRLVRFVRDGKLWRLPVDTGHNCVHHNETQQEVKPFTLQESFKKFREQADRDAGEIQSREAKEEQNSARARNNKRIEQNNALLLLELDEARTQLKEVIIQAGSTEKILKSKKINDLCLKIAKIERVSQYMEKISHRR